MVELLNVFDEVGAADHKVVVGFMEQVDAFDVRTSAFPSFNRRARVDGGRKGSAGCQTVGVLVLHLVGSSALDAAAPIELLDDGRVNIEVKQVGFDKVVDVRANGSVSGREIHGAVEPFAFGAVVGNESCDLVRARRVAEEAVDGIVAFEGLSVERENRS